MSIFQKIIDRQIPADIVYEDERCLAFRDVAPQAPVHVLVIPKLLVESVAHATQAHESLLGHLLWVTGEVARREGVSDSGFRVVINTGGDAGQSVFHLHLHVLAGRPLGWPPG